MEKAKIEVIVNRKDDYGNRLTYDESTGKLQLSQSNEPNRWRPIGTLISKDDLMIYSKHEKESDKYRKYKAWSVYYIILEICDAIRYETEEFVYYITKEDLFTYGQSVMDKGHGNGRKVVCPIRFWTVFPKNKGYSKLLASLGYEWFDELKEVFKSDKMKSVGKFVREQRKLNVVYPTPDKVFRPFRETPYTETKVILFDVGPFSKDADGLAFSTEETSHEMNPITSHLLDFIEETVYDGFTLNKEHSLIRWAEQGVLLLNSRYTANQYGPASHANKGWEDFNKEIITKLCSDRLHKPIVFILLGDDNIKMYKNHIESIQGSIHLALNGEYPNTDDKLVKQNNKIFNQCNDFLIHNHLTPIQW